MLKKLSVAVIALAAAYVGGSYYVGLRAEQQLVAMMSDAQARASDELAFEQVDVSHGLFTSTGSALLVLKQIKTATDDPEAEAVKTRINYTIHHHLHWARLAHFLWSVTPEQALAKQMEPLYPETPSLAGDGMLDWSGVATSSIAFPRIENRQVDGGSLTMAPVVGNLRAGRNFFDLKLGVAELIALGQGSRQRLQLKNLSYEMRSDDVASGSAAVTFLLGDLLAIDEDGNSSTMTEFRWDVDGTYQNDTLTLTTQNTIASLTVSGSEASDVQVSIGIDGLHREDLNELAALVDELNGQWQPLNDTQQARAQRLGLSLLKRGLSLRAPAIKARVKLLGQDNAQTAGIEGFVVSAQASDPAQGVGQIRVALDTLTVPEFLQLFVPQVTGFEVEVTNALTEGRTDLTVKHALASYAQSGQSVRDVAFEARLKGLSAQGLLEVIEMTLEHGGDLTDLSQEQSQILEQIVHDAASHGLLFQMPVLKGAVEAGTGQVDVLELLGLDLSVKLDDVATGAGSANFTINKLLASGPQMVDVPSVENYRLAVTNTVTDGKADYQIEKSIQSFASPMVKLGSSELSMRLTGVSATDLQRLSDLAPAFEQGLDQAQTAEVAQILRRALASGFAFSVPKLRLAIDDAQVNGQGKVALVGIGSDPISTFDLARQGQLQAEIAVVGKSPWLAPLVQQGLALGLLAIDGDVAKGQYRFGAGRLSLNGVTVPTGQFLPMANLMVQQMLAQGQAPQSDSQSDADNQAPKRQRRGPGN